MKLSETIWRLSLVENVKSKLENISSTADKAGMRVNSMQGRINSFSTNTAGSLQGVSNLLPGIGGGLMSYVVAPLTIAATAVIAIGAQATKMSMEFAQGMAKINATAQLPKKELNALRDDLIDIGRQGTGGNIMRLPDAFEKINSQVNDTNLSMDILKTSVKGAKAGFADLDLVGNAVAQSMSAIGAEKTNATEVLDTLMSAKRSGAGEFNDFATYIPQLIAQGRNLGIGFKDVAGTFAFMTAKGQSAADSAMLIQNAYSVLGRSEIQKGLANFGVNIFDKNGAIRGLDKIFTDLEQKTRHLSDQQKTMLFQNIGLMDAQAKQAFSVLMGDSEKLKTIMDDVRNGAGEIDRTLNATANPMTQLADLGDRFKAIMLDIGNSIMDPIIDSVLWIGNGIADIIEGVRDWYRESEFLQDLAWMLGKAFDAVFWVIKQIGREIKIWYDQTIKPIGDLLDALVMVDPTLRGIHEMRKADEAKNAVNQPVAPVSEWGSTEVANLFEQKDRKDRITNSSTIKSIDSIHGGGTQNRNINITVMKLQDHTVINTTSTKEGVNDMVKILEEGLVRVVNGVEMALSNG